ncbi:MAG: hypothetical protein JRD03_02395 [Deltaproteobacteria bacterium]|nr:hypothetical protein [Deltaproteobacteria bacterium]
MTSPINVRQIMLDFAGRTGLISSEYPPVRYLWTDAFAVCNFLGLFVEHADEEALRLARRLVDQTHHVLGRHRPDDPRCGWISGLSEEQGEAHPTRGGLRIGKPLPDQGPAAPALEWDRDGQYFHYLTRWMHALDQLARVTGDATYHRWACELASTAYAGFTHAAASGTKRLVWKMSIDLSRPQVTSMGLHDPLDGFLTYCQLQATSSDDAKLDLSREIRELAGLCADRSWDTDDALGIGGLLCDAHRLVQLTSAGELNEPQLLEDLLRSSLRGLETLVAQGVFRGGAENRLGFRELGLSIGLHAVERIRGLGAEPCAVRLGALLENIIRYQPMADQIEQFWLEPTNRESTSWRDHRDINDVMLATSLAPAGYQGALHRD